MTLESDQAEPAVARAAHNPPSRRRPPPARHANGTVDQLEEMKKQIAELKAQVQRGYQTVESEPAQQAKVHRLAPEALSDFQRRLLARTHAVPPGYGGDREPGFNIPAKWYLRPDGMFVQLQGDAKNRVYYEEKGFHPLSAAEQEQYLTVERPKQIQIEQTRAALINGLRQLVRRENVLAGYQDDQAWDAGLADMSVEQLREEWVSLCAQTANPKRRLPMAERHREERDTDSARLLSGVEIVAPRVVREALEQATTQQPQHRLIPVTPANARQFS